MRQKGILRTIKCATIPPNWRQHTFELRFPESNERLGRTQTISCDIITSIYRRNSEVLQKQCPFHRLKHTHTRTHSILHSTHLNILHTCLSHTHKTTMCFSNGLICGALCGFGTLAHTHTHRSQPHNVCTWHLCRLDKRRYLYPYVFLLAAAENVGFRIQKINYNSQFTLLDFILKINVTITNKYSPKM